MIQTQNGQRAHKRTPLQTGVIVFNGKRGQETFKASSERTAPLEVQKKLRIGGFTDSLLKKAGVLSVSLGTKVLYDAGKRGHSNTPFASDKVLKRHRPQRPATASR